MSDPAYLHEIRGIAFGQAAGRQQGFNEGEQHGYSAGHRDGWNEAIQTTNPTIEALRQERDALARDRLDLQYAANAFAVISRAMQAVIVNAPAGMQVEAIRHYNDLCARFLDNGVLRVEPHVDATVKARDSEVADFFPKLAQRLNARSSYDDDPSP